MRTERPWQAGHETYLARRLLRYNVLLDERHDPPTRSLVVLLRPEADGRGMSGVYRRPLPGGPDFLEFRYEVVRAWRQPVESVLECGLGTLPLAPVADLAKMAPEEVIRRMGERIDREPMPRSRELWTAAGLLMGMRYPADIISTLLKGVKA